MKRSILILFLFCLNAEHVIATVQYVGMDVYTLPESTELSPLSSGAGIYNGQVVGAKYAVNGIPYAATVWNAPSGTSVDLHHPSFPVSFAWGTDGIRQVGVGGSSYRFSGPEHALMWSGSASAVVDLHPVNLGYIATSTAFDVTGNAQVGYAILPLTFQNHAILWHGTAASAVDLHPLSLPAEASSIAFATDGIQQVGSVNAVPGVQGRAALWSGSRASYVDLHPTSGTFFASRATDVMGGQQVGFGELVDDPIYHDTGIHALLWTGSAASVIDLNPTNLGPYGYVVSSALGTDGVRQVGWGRKLISETEYLPESALLWHGSAESAVDLHALLPAGFNSSRAHSISSTGVIWGLARDADSHWHVVKWTPVPEPLVHQLALFGFASVSMVVRCRSRRRVPSFRAVL